MQTRNSHPCWQCPKVNCFWEAVCSTINTVFTIHIPKSFSILFLGNIPDEVGQDDKYLFKILLATSKKAKTQKWYKVDPPTREEWLQIITEVREMEKNTHVLQLQMQIFE